MAAPPPIRHDILLDGLDQAVNALLSAPPEGIAAEILAALRFAQTALSPKLFYETVRQAQIAISITDLSGNIIYANPAFAKVTGYQEEEVLGANESLLSDKKTPPEVYADLWQSLQTRESWRGRLLNRRKNGERYLAEVLIAPVIDAEGEVINYVGMHRDITDVYRLQQRVRNQKALFKTVIDNAPAVVALLEEDGNVALHNHAYQKLAQDLDGLVPATIFMDAFKPDLSVEEWQAQQHRLNHLHEREVMFTPPNGGTQRWFMCSATWIEAHGEEADSFFASDHKSYLLLIANEVSALKKQQEEVRTSALRALLAEEALGDNLEETIAAALHQLQVPMNLVHAALGSVSRCELCRNEQCCPSQDVLQQALEAGEEAIENLRRGLPGPDSAWQESLEPLNINQLLRDILTISTDRLLAAGVVVDWQPALSLPPVLGRKGRLGTLFKQLIDNAIEAMEGHRSRVRELRLITACQDNTIIIKVQDSGPGIPQHLHFKVFEPFFTTKQRRRHIGMGLAGAQDVVNLHTGGIWIDPEYRGGCSVVVELPCHQREN
jgi:nitrogen fixation regulatory protein